MSALIKKVSKAKFKPGAGFRPAVRCAWHVAGLQLQYLEVLAHLLVPGASLRGHEARGLSLQQGFA